MSLEKGYARHIVETALRRSLGFCPHIVERGGCLVAHFGPGLFWAGEGALKGKALVFGPPPSAMAPLLGLRAKPGLRGVQGCDACAPAVADAPFTLSPGFVLHREHPLGAELAPAIRERPFTRFDYADEWNNLGFGRIRSDASAWSVFGGLEPDGALELAAMFANGPGGPDYLGAYLTLFDSDLGSALWCARPVGPVDSTEWSLIERFLSDWRAGELPCLPCLRQTPANCRCLVTMRLDCDEDVASCRDLFAFYAGQGIPFSLAVKTGLEFGPQDLRLLEEVRASGGALLSHSHTHPQNWGENAGQALAEALTSRDWFRQSWPESPVPDLAVSPFHSNPPYAVKALAEAGFRGFVAGIIHNDPEYMLGRAGLAPFADGAMVSISQQSMLHGDCYARQGQNLDAHLAAFEIQYAAGGIFGYLDHPFSDRYQYDWQSEEQRLDAHARLVAAIRSFPGVLFWSQQQCFDFVRALQTVRFSVLPDSSLSASGGCPGVMYRYMGREHAL